MRPDHYASRNPYCHKPQVGRAVVRATGRAGVATVKVGFKHRNKLAPLFVAAGLAIASTVLHIVDAVTGWQTALVIAVILSLLLGGKQYLARRHEEPWPTSSLVQSWVALASAAGWTAVAASMAPWTTPMPGYLVAGWLVSQAAWLWHHRERTEVVMEPVEEIVGDHDPRVLTWVTAVAADGGPLPGAELMGLKENKHGWSATIALRPGKQTTSNAVSAVEVVASAYELPPQSVAIEPTADGMASRASIQVYERNPLQKRQDWTGEGFSDDGVMTIGVHPDGKPAAWRLWRPGLGGVHGLISGAPRTGKSRLLDLLLCGQRLHPHVSSWVGDPQNGQSLPDWQNAVDRFARTSKQSVEMLRDAYDEMLDRNKRAGELSWRDEKGRERQGKVWTPPTKKEPFLAVTLDEAHSVFEDPEAVHYAEKIGLMGPKCNIAIVLVTHVPLLSQLGNSTPLRDAVASGNVVVFRTASSLTAQVAFNGNLGVDPRNLPRAWPDGSTTAGTGYLLGDAARQAQMRGLYVEDPFDYASAGETTTVGFVRKHQEEREEVRPAIQVSTASKKDAVEAYLIRRNEWVLTGAIAEALNFSKSTVSQSCRKLAEEGRVVDGGHGRWAAPSVAKPGHEMANSVA